MKARISYAGQDYIISDAKEAFTGVSAKEINKLIFDTEKSKRLSDASLSGGILQADDQGSMARKVDELSEGLRILRLLLERTPK